MTSYLLDTNIVSDLIRNPHGAVLAHIEAVGEDHVATNIIVAAELRYGAEKKGAAALIDRVDAILSRISVLPIGPGVDKAYGRIRAEMERKGTPIGADDLLIAAHVDFLSENAAWILVTANEAEFERIEGLRIENWIDHARV